MATLLETLARARDKHAQSDERLRAAIINAKTVHSWAEIAAVLNLPVGTVRWIAGTDKRQREESVK